MANSELESGYLGRGEMRGTKPVTDRESKRVMLRAERGDTIRVSEVTELFRSNQQIPDEFTVERRISTYYGTELLLSPGNSDQELKFLLTAPGPDTHLYLWAPRTDDDGFREEWFVAAELCASFGDDMPQYPLCRNCGEPIKSLEHERLAILDKCPSGAD